MSGVAKLISYVMGIGLALAAPTFKGLLMKGRIFMRPIDLSPLIKGLMVIILLALAVGQYNRFCEFALKQGKETPKAWDLPI